MQETFIRVWKHFDGYKEEIKITTWIYKIALNTAISFYRNDCKNNYSRTEFQEAFITCSSIDNSENDFFENIQLLYAFIERLNEMDKALILLYLDDTKYFEISEILGISETNVATKISRIKIKLRRYFNSLIVS